MYCQRCYADLRSATEKRCPACGLGFDPANPKTYLARPLPPRRRIVRHIIATTVLGIVFAWVVAMFQSANIPSGH